MGAPSTHARGSKHDRIDGRLDNTERVLVRVGRPWPKLKPAAAPAAKPQLLCGWEDREYCDTAHHQHRLIKQMLFKHGCHTPADAAGAVKVSAASIVTIDRVDP